MWRENKYGKSIEQKAVYREYGATSKNWKWSWSFINNDRQIVIFGAWDSEHEQDRAVILRK